MNRRDFLKRMVAVTAGGMAMLKLPGDQHMYQGQFYAAGYPGTSDIVIESSELIRDDLRVGHQYRGLAYVRDNPESKKYFSTFVDSPDVVASRKFTKDLHAELLRAFQA